MDISRAISKGTPYLTRPASGSIQGITPKKPVNCVCKTPYAFAVFSEESDVPADDAVCLPAEIKLIGRRISILEYSAEYGLDFAASDNQSMKHKWYVITRHFRVRVDERMMENKKECELVANLTGQPPPIPMICDDGKAENNGGCTRDVRRNLKAAKDHPAEESGTMLFVIIEIRKSSDTTKGQFIKFRADSNVLSELGGTVKTAFESKSSTEFLKTLPQGRLRDRIYSLTGQPGKKRIKLDHLEGNELVFDIVRRKSLGVCSKDHILMEGIEHSSLVMRNDFDEQKYTGVQDASFGIHARDLLDAGNGKTIMSQSYRWQHQYVKHISPDDFKRLYYDLPLPFLAHDGTTIGDVLDIRTSSESTSSHPTRRNRDLEKLLIYSGYSPTPGQDDIVLAGEDGDMPVRVGSGISFTFDQWHHKTREMVSGYGNPSLRTCHGFVAAIAAASDGNDGSGSIVLSVRLVLGKGNLPPFFIWERMSPYAVIQTNLQVVVPARCVVSTFLIKPVVLHSLAAFLPESMPVLGAEAMPITRDVYVIGHFDFEQGDFQDQGDSGQQDERANGWQNRYVDSNTNAFALLSDFCARGGPIIDGPFKELHGPWKTNYLDWTKSHQGGRYLPRVTLSSLPPFPAESALRTIDKSVRLTGFPSFDASLVELRAAVRGFALSKAKRATNGRQGGRILFSPNIPGSLLLQLVHVYVRRYTPAFREGAVEAVVDEFPLSEKLLDTKDGEFNLGEFGIVRFEAPITFRCVHYDPKRTESAPPGEGGRAEIIFKKYIAKDRHGADVTGEIYGDEDREGGEKHEGEMTWSLQVNLKRRLKRLMMLTCNRRFRWSR